MMRIWCVCLSMLVASCAFMQPDELKGPSGKAAYSMRCSKMSYTLNDCYKKAGEYCSNGYTINERISGTVGVPVRGGIMTVPHYNIGIECS